MFIYFGLALLISFLALFFASFQVQWLSGLGFDLVFGMNFSLVVILVVAS